MKLLLLLCADVLHVFQGEPDGLDKVAAANASRHPPTCAHPLFASQETASAIWSKNLDSIVEWTRNPRDRAYKERSLVTDEVLPVLSPSNLRRAVMSQMAHSDVARILSVVEARFRDPDQHPPLTVLVVGGSVAWGQGCFTHQPIKIPFCRWSYRFESLVNNALGFKAIRVINGAIGGTQTDLASNMLEFGLYPNGVPAGGPDVVINGYSTNEMHVLSMKNAKQKNVTLESQIYDLMQQFIVGTLTGNWALDASSPRAPYARAPGPHCDSMTRRQQRAKCRHEAWAAARAGPASGAFSQRGNQAPEDRELNRHRKRPVVIYLDDYLGNEQRGVLDTMLFNTVLHRLATHYSISAVSSADAVRRAVYADTEERSFSPLGWYRLKGAGMRREVHLPPGGHIAIAWALVFSMLTYVTEFCVDTRYTGKPGRRGRPLPSCPPPRLDKSLKLDDVSSAWRSACAVRTAPAAAFGASCAFAWISGLGVVSTTDALSRVLSPVMTNVRGAWMASDDHGKLGLLYNTSVEAAASGPTPGFEIVLNRVVGAAPSRKAVFMYMKSFGPAWKESLVRVSGWNLSGAKLFEEELDAYFRPGESQISVTVTKRVYFNPAHGVRIKFDLVGGKQFKCTGLAVCN